MHYTERVDKIFNTTLHEHRTLRTLFDNQSSEWNETSIEQKNLLLEKMVESGYPLQDWIDDYHEFYVMELNKDWAVDSIESSLSFLKENCKDQNIINEINKCLKP
jgi:hypothetical protein